MESSPVATKSDELENDPSTLVAIEEAGGDCISELLWKADDETPGNVIGDDTGELETPCEEDPASELLADTPGLEDPCEEVTAFELLAGPLKVDDAGGVTTLESDEDALMTMLVRLVTVLLVVST